MVKLIPSQNIFLMAKPRLRRNHCHITVRTNVSVILPGFVFSVFKKQPPAKSFNFQLKHIFCRILLEFGWENRHGGQKSTDMRRASVPFVTSQGAVTTIFYHVLTKAFCKAERAKQAKAGLLSYPVSSMQPRDRLL